MRQKMQFRKVKIALLEDVLDCLLPLYLVFHSLFCPLCRREIEILVNSCLFSLALKDLLRNLRCLITSSLSCTKFGKNVLKLMKRKQEVIHISYSLWRMATILYNKTKIGDSTHASIGYLAVAMSS